MKKLSSSFLIISILLAGIFFSCQKEPEAVNQSPIANAGKDTTIILPEDTVYLNGSLSTDPDNNIISYQWTKVDGPASFTIANANLVTTRVTGLVEGVYRFELKVTDAGGLFSKDMVQVTVSPPPDIYVAGYENNGSNVSVAKYWKNGQAVNLTDGLSSAARAYSIAVAGSDVYVAGWESQFLSGYIVFVAKYWKNGQVVNLTNGSNDAQAYSIAIAGSDVYVAGYDYKAGKLVAKYWKNGQAVNLTNGSNDAQAYSIAIAGSDVYVAGYESNAAGNFVAKYWKNGQVVNLTDGLHRANAYSVVVSGSDVYVAGIEYNNAGKPVAKYWKNGVAVNLTNGSNEASANSIAVVGSDVYVAGFDGYMAKYWKNGIAVNLPTNASAPYPAGATSIVVVGSDVYVAGIQYNGQVDVAKYWKNGQVINLTDGSKQAIAWSIVVAKH
jgi:hypothetical protein